MWDEDQGGGRHRERDADTYEAEPMRRDIIKRNMRTRKRKMIRITIATRAGGDRSRNGVDIGLRMGTGIRKGVMIKPRIRIGRRIRYE